MPEEDRATDIGNVHKKFDKDHAYGSGNILVDRQTHRQTDPQTSQYFATTPAGEVIRHSNIRATNRKMPILI